jgi:hypothetical protein
MRVDGSLRFEVEVEMVGKEGMRDDDIAGTCAPVCTPFLAHCYNSDTDII